MVTVSRISLLPSTLHVHKLVTGKHSGRETASPLLGVGVAPRVTPAAWITRHIIFASVQIVDL